MPATDCAESQLRELHPVQPKPSGSHLRRGLRQLPFPGPLGKITAHDKPPELVTQNADESSHIGTCFVFWIGAIESLGGCAEAVWSNEDGIEEDES